MDGLAEAVPARVLDEWRAWWSIEPDGPDLLKLLAAQITAAVYNVNRDTKEQREPWPIDDFVLAFQDNEFDESEKSPEQIYSILRDIALIYGAQHGNPGDTTDSPGPEDG